EHDARGRQVDARDEVEQGGLARAAAAEQHRDLARGHDGIDVAEHHALALTLAVDLGQLAELHRGRAHRSAILSAARRAAGAAARDGQRGRYLANTSLRRSVVRAAGLARICFSCSPSTWKRPSRPLPVT